jgi:hypothetical protein
MADELSGHWLQTSHPEGHPDQRAPAQGPLSVLAVPLGLVAAVVAPVLLNPVQFVALLCIGAFVGTMGAMLSHCSEEDPELDSRVALLGAARGAVAGAVLAVAAGAVVLALGPNGWVAVMGAVATYAALRAVLRRGPDLV